jgi:recombinational DNA repair protein (RecF pathway)
MKRDFVSKSILLRKTRYKDNLYIIRVFTKEAGLLDARVRVSLKGKIHPSLLDPMNVLMASFKKTRHPEYFEMDEASLEFSPILNKPSVFLILNVIREICLKTLHDLSPDERKFTLLEENIYQTVKWESHIPRGLMLSFLRDWANASGIMPAGKNTNEEKYFSISEGKFVLHHASDGLTLNESLSELMNDFIQTGLIPHAHEQVLTDVWIKYMQFHINELKVLKSIEVIKDLKYSL